jgi:hypothetical protein
MVQRTDSIEAAAGRDDVALVLDPGAEIRVRLDPAEPAPSSVFVAAEGEKDEGAAEVAHATREGLYRLRGLRPDRAYTVWTAMQEGQPAGIASGLRPSGAVQVVRRTPSRAVYVQVAIPDGDVRADYLMATLSRGPVSVHAGASLRGGAGLLQFEGVPEGAWHVRVIGVAGNAIRLVGEVDAELRGESIAVAVVLRPVGP